MIQLLLIAIGITIILFIILIVKLKRHKKKYDAIMKTLITNQKTKNQRK